MASYATYQAERERTERRARQDRFLAAQQSSFDADVAANTDKRGGWKRMNYERAQFTVVTASPEYRAGYDRIQWSPLADHPSSQVTPPAEAVQEDKP